jgi:hypothetical protein
MRNRAADGWERKVVGMKKIMLVKGIGGWQKNLEMLIV